MTRLVTGLTVLVLAVLAATAASAQQADPMHLGFFTPAALEGPFQAGLGKLAFLAIASPRNCNDGSSTTLCPHPLRVYFYDATCTRVNSIPTPLTQNAALLFAIGAATSATSGNFLVAHGVNATSTQLRVEEGFRNPVVGTLFQVDVNRGVAWSEALAQLSGDSGQGWSPYRPTAVAPFLPPDGGIAQVTLRFRCPVGAALLIPPGGGHPEDFTSHLDKFKGTEGTLGGDMIEAVQQSRGNFIGGGYFPDLDDSSTVGPNDLAGCCSSGAVSPGGISGFATTITIHAYDTNENPLAVVSGLPCSCLSEARLSTLVPAAASQATYLEIEGFAASRNLGSGSVGGIFVATWQLQVTTGGLNVFVSRRMHYAPDSPLLTAGF